MAPSYENALAPQALALQHGTREQQTIHGKEGGRKRRKKYDNKKRSARSREVLILARPRLVPG